MNSRCCNSKIQKDYLGNKRCSYCMLIAAPKWNFRILYIFIFGMILMGFSVKGIKPKDIPKYNICRDSCDVELEDSCILKELISDSCIFPEIALKQIHKESNWYKSQLTKENKNLLGLKCSCLYTKGFKNGHSEYSSYKNCIKCYTIFFNSYWNKYFKNYAEDPNYQKNITKM